MDRENLGRFYAKNVGLIHTVARKGFGRLQAIGAATDYDDIFQDLTEVFIEAYDKFDESKGFQFSSYFVRSAYNELNKSAKKFEIERIELGIRSVEEMESWSDNIESEHGGNIAERIASGSATPEQTLEAAGMEREMQECLSPLASLMVRLTIDPPEFIEREFYAGMAHAELAREAGIERRARVCLNLSFVGQVLEKTTDLSFATIRAARYEIADYVKRGSK